MGRGARRLADGFPLTARGLLVLALAGLALTVFGYRSLDLVAFSVGAGGIGTVALALLAVGGAWLHARRLSPRSRAGRLARLEAGSPIHTGFERPALGRLPLVELRWSWLSPEDVECRLQRVGDQLEEQVVAQHRGERSGLRRRFVVSDVFGLAAIAWEREEPTPVTILPDVRSLRRAPVLHAFSSADGVSHPAGAPEGDRIDIRRYAPGDSVRDILWKSFARTRQLNVRIRERSIERARRTIAYLVAGDGDEPAAAAARLALESGALGAAWRFGADGTPGATDDLDAALHAIARSGAREVRQAGGASGLDAFLRDAEGGSVESCVVFAPACSGPWVERALAATRAHPGRLSFVLATDGISGEAAPSPLWQRVLYAAPDAPGIASDDLRRLLGEVASTGSSALVVDRASGRSFSLETPGFVRMTA